MIPADQHHFDTACDDRPYCVIASHHDVDALAESRCIWCHRLGHAAEAHPLPRDHPQYDAFYDASDDELAHMASAAIAPGRPAPVDRCPRCGEPVYSPAETEQHNRDVHNVGPVASTSWGAEP